METCADLTVKKDRKDFIMCNQRNATTAHMDEMKQVTLQQEIRAAATIKLAKWEKMGGWKDPMSGNELQARTVQVFCKDTRHQQECSDVTKKLHQSIQRSVMNREIKRAGTKRTFNDSLEVILEDIRKHRAPYFERNDQARKLLESIHRSGIHREILQVAKERTYLMDSRSDKQSKAQHALCRTAHRILMNDIKKRSHDVEIAQEEKGPLCCSEGT